MSLWDMQGLFNILHPETLLQSCLFLWWFIAHWFLFLYFWTLFLIGVNSIEWSAEIWECSDIGQKKSERTRHKSKFETNSQISPTVHYILQFRDLLTGSTCTVVSVTVHTQLSWVSMRNYYNISGSLTISFTLKKDQCFPTFLAGDYLKCRLIYSQNPFHHAVA